MFGLESSYIFFFPHKKKKRAIIINNSFLPPVHTLQKNGSSPLLYSLQSRMITPGYNKKVYVSRTLARVEVKRPTRKREGVPSIFSWRNVKHKGATGRANDRQDFFPLMIKTHVKFLNSLFLFWIHTINVDFQPHTCKLCTKKKKPLIMWYTQNKYS
jgi:hypothetical protein